MPQLVSNNGNPRRREAKIQTNLRLTVATRRLLDRLAQVLANESELGHPWSHADVVELAVKKLAREKRLIDGKP